MKIDIQVITKPGDERLGNVFEVRKEVFVKEQKIDPSLEYDEFDEPGSGSTHILLLYDGVPVGAARLIKYKDGYAKLQRVAVLKKFRGLNLGRALVLEAEKYAASTGFAGMILNAQLAVKGFYSLIGYETVSPETFFEAGIEHIQMIKNF